MDILKLLSCKGNKSSVVGQEVVIDFKENRWCGTLMTVLMIWLVSDFCTLMLVGARAKRWWTHTTHTHLHHISCGLYNGTL